MTAETCTQNQCASQFLRGVDLLPQRFVTALVASSIVLAVSACSEKVAGSSNMVPTAAGSSAAHRSVRDATPPPYPVCTPSADPNCGTPPDGGANPDGTPCIAAGDPACDTSTDPFGPERGPQPVPPWYTPQCADEYGTYPGHPAWHQCYARELWKT